MLECSVVTRAVVDSLSRQCRDNRKFFDCRHANPTLSTENSVLSHGVDSVEALTPLVATVATCEVRQSTDKCQLRQQL